MYLVNTFAARGKIGAWGVLCMARAPQNHRTEE